MGYRIMNIKRVERGMIIAQFDLGIAGVTVLGCRLFDKDGKHFIGMPQRNYEKDGETKWVDTVEMTWAEKNHVKHFVLAALNSGSQSAQEQRSPAVTENHASPPPAGDHGGHGDDDIPF